MASICHAVVKHDAARSFELPVGIGSRIQTVKSQLRRRIQVDFINNASRVGGHDAIHPRIKCQSLRRRPGPQRKLIIHHSARGRYAIEHQIVGASGQVNRTGISVSQAAGKHHAVGRYEAPSDAGIRSNQVVEVKRLRACQREREGAQPIGRVERDRLHAIEHQRCTDCVQVKQFERNGAPAGVPVTV